MPSAEGAPATRDPFSSPDARTLLTQVRRAHRLVARRLVEAAPRPADVLDLGAAVLLHGALERRWLHALNPALDRAAVDRLNEEHDRLADDLDLLESLLESNPDSPDVGPLSAALLDRLREHVARDERVLYTSTLGVRIESA